MHQIFSDGSLGANTAAIRTSDDSNDHSGILIHSSNDLCESICDSVQHNMRLEIHAIGDAAALQVLRAMEAGQSKTGKELYRPILTHCQVLGADILEYMKRLGVIANVQPSFVPTGKKQFDIQILVRSTYWLFDIQD
jgi:predicted amidohydrolase YtcJ